VTLVVDGDGRVAGIITDGDLRRIFLGRPPAETEKVLAQPVGEFHDPPAEGRRGRHFRRRLRCASWR